MAHDSQLAALGTTTKSHSATGGENDHAAVRIERYQLQAVSRVILPGERVSKCLRWRIDKDKPVTVWKSREHKKAHYGGLQVCGSVWVCPVCAAKISEQRRAELMAAVATHKASGGDVLLMTLTNSHDRSDVLSDLLNRQAEALTKFRQRREGMRLFKALGVVGMVRALEVTHGSNGWHPHYHFLLFIERPLSDSTVQNWQADVALYWMRCCQAAGLPLPSIARGVDVRGGEYASRYASKWGLESEMTKAHIKRGRASSRTPFDFLRSCLRDGDDNSVALFAEYAAAFKGRRQLVWSRGLKQRLGVLDLSDEEIAERQEDEADLLGMLEREDWTLVCRFEVRGELLKVAELEGWNGVTEFLFRLYQREAASVG